MWRFGDAHRVGQSKMRRAYTGLTFAADGSGTFQVRVKAAPVVAATRVRREKRWPVPHWTTPSTVEPMPPSEVHSERQLDTQSIQSIQTRDAPVKPRATCRSRSVWRAQGPPLMLRAAPLSASKLRPSLGERRCRAGAACSSSCAERQGPHSSTDQLGRATFRPEKSAPIE